MFLFSRICSAQLNWKLDYDSANIAFLILDYNTYNLENAYFAKYKYYPDYDRYSIPFKIVYHSPSDSGDILFTYKSTIDTVFYASIWWMGRGRIIYPKILDSANLFTYDTVNVSHPYSTEYYKYLPEISDELFHSKADSAWESVKKLSILKEFAKVGNEFRIGLYLYAPAVGLFNPEPAKWIIFLYRGQIIVDVKNETVKLNDYTLFQNYPNPWNPTTTINYSIAKEGNVKLTVYNALGSKVATIVNEYKPAGNYSVQFNGSNRASGIYLYRLESGNYSAAKKFVLMK
jgi:hypothetical protein